MTGKLTPVKLTTRTLTLGTLAAAALLAMGLALDLAGLSSTAALLGNIGVIALLLTPVAGLVSTWWELRRPRPRAAWLAVAVLGWLALATLIALSTRA